MSNRPSPRHQTQFREVVSDPSSPWQTDASAAFSNDGAWHHVACTIDRSKSGEGEAVCVYFPSP